MYEGDGCARVRETVSERPSQDVWSETTTKEQQTWKLTTPLSVVSSVMWSVMSNRRESLKKKGGDQLQTK